MGQTCSLSNKEGKPSPCVLPRLLWKRSTGRWMFDTGYPQQMHVELGFKPKFFRFPTWVPAQRCLTFLSQASCFVAQPVRTVIQNKNFPPWEHMVPDSLSSTCVCASCSAHLHPIISPDKLRPTPILLSVLLGLFTTKYKTCLTALDKWVICEFFISFFSLEFLFSSSMPGTVKGT